MTPTKRNHYNPCFWTAYWNPAYFDLARRGEQHKASPRHQKVSVLNIKSNKIYQQSVENLHFDKGMGIAEITPEAAKDFCRRHHPAEYEQFCKNMESHPETLYLDFENILTGLEGSVAYTTLLSVVRRGCITGLPEKGALAGFLTVHTLRGHALMNSMLELMAAAGQAKFEHFVMLKHFLSDPKQLFPLTMALTSGRWTFYQMYEDTFPLTDTPIFIQPQSVMAIISPRLLLEIDRTKPENGWSSVNSISAAKLDEFRKRAIGNTFREIIFGTPKLLEEWQRSPEFADRSKLMAETTAYNAKIAEHLGRELWKVNAHGNTMP